MEAQVRDAVVARIDVGRRDVDQVRLADLGLQITDALPPRGPRPRSPRSASGWPGPAAAGPVRQRLARSAPELDEACPVEVWREPG